MDSAHWPQVVEDDEEEGRRGVLERSKANKAGGGKDEILKCPRCNSNNTKFCYYNNYSLSQPRYFCKSCRRYWTAGGSLRNIPVGGASRKNKRLSSPNNNNFSSPAPSSSSNNKIIINHDHDHDHNYTNNTSSCWLSSTDHHMNQIMLRSSNGIGMSQSQRELIPFMPMPAAAAPQPTSMCTTASDHCHINNNNNGLFEGEAATTTVEQLPTIISTDHHHQNGGKLGDVVPPAFWNAIFGGASSSW